MTSTGYKSILVAVDFSEYSQNAVAKAYEIAQAFHAELRMVHFVEIPIYPVLEDVAVMGMPGLWDETASKSLIEASNKKLSELSAKFNIKKYEALSGIASVDIVEYANNIQCDLIVIGAHGLSGIQHLIGSTTNSVINHAKCDVLAVRVSE
ncbi:universal stress protein [Thiomicrorhabdus hydrogeniphila]